MPDQLKPEDFQPLTAPLTLEVQFQGNPVAITVLSVKLLPPHRFRDAPFALSLSGPRSPLLPQANYSTQHPRLGRIDLFLVPVGQDAQSTEYEATYN